MRAIATQTLVVPQPQPLVLSERGTPNEPPTYFPRSSAKGSVASEEENGAPACDLETPNKPSSTVRSWN